MLLLPPPHSRTSELYLDEGVFWFTGLLKVVTIWPRWPSEEVLCRVFATKCLKIPRFLAKLMLILRIFWPRCGDIYGTHPRARHTGYIFAQMSSENINGQRAAAWPHLMRCFYWINTTWIHLRLLKWAVKAILTAGRMSVFKCGGVRKRDRRGYLGNTRGAIPEPLHLRSSISYNVYVFNTAMY